MKINLKLKTRLKTEILVILITLSIASIININGNFSNANQEVETLNTSAPITPKYKYIYENDFDYYDSYFHLVSSANLIGYDIEWSQDPNDIENLQLDFTCIVGPNTIFDDIEGTMFVESHNTYKKQQDHNLGAYIDWKIDMDVPYLDNIFDVQFYLSLNILKPTKFEQLVTIENFNPQEGTFYLSNFDQYIWNDGKIRFALRGLFIGDTSRYVWGGAVISIKFEGLRVVQELKPIETEAEKRTLIFVHGFNLDGHTNPTTHWDNFKNSTEFKNAYDNMIVISYYGLFKAYEYRTINGKFKLVDTYINDADTLDTNTPIEVISALIYLYILQHQDSIEDNVDFVSHSMGGLITRCMIKEYYQNIKEYYENLGRNFNIKNVCMIATPNHGVWYGALINFQLFQMGADSPFINYINSPTEIPQSGQNISWFTYRSGIVYQFDTRIDSLVDINSVPLTGAINKGLYNCEHTEFLNRKMMKTIIFNDLFKPPGIIDTIFDGGTPGIIMQIEDLTLQPNYDAPGGKTLLSITLPAEDAVDIDSTTVTLYVSTYNYQMTLKAGTTDTYEVELPLAEGNYSFLITADELMLDGWLYQMSGNLIIIDDDVKPPVIQITPEDLSISDEDAVGGVSIAWEISDYSGISEANVLLNGIEIRSYTNEGTITDSYVLANHPGVYTFSVWARDNDDDLAHNPPGEDWSENSTERTITIYDDDKNLPDIKITPGDLSISDEDAVGGVLISWEITDYSGILEANVTLNGVEISSYANQGTITDSYLLPSEPGVYTISIWAKDNDNDLEDDWLEYSTERIITIYDDDLNPPEIEITPGDLTISVEEAEGGVLISWEISDYSGISEANILLNGIEIQSYANQGTIIDSYLLANEPGVYNFSIWAKDNDNDLEDDWLEYSTKITITIYEVDDIPPPAIPGYSVSVLLGILAVVIILISKKRRNYKI